MTITTELAHLRTGKPYVIIYRDNYDGERSVYPMIAIPDENGDWWPHDGGDRLMQYQGDEILKAWAIDELEAKDKQIAGLESEIKSANDRYENRTPTQWAYDQACSAIEKHRLRADAVESRIAELEARREQQPALSPEEINAIKAEGLAELLKDAAEYSEDRPISAKEWSILAKNWHQFFVGLSQPILPRDDDGAAVPAARTEQQPVVTCWSCKEEVEVESIGHCDGYCPNCNQPIDLDDEPYASAPAAQPVTVKLPEDIIDQVCLTAAEIHNRGRGVSDDKAQWIIDRIRDYLEGAGITIAEGE